MMKDHEISIAARPRPSAIYVVLTCLSLLLVAIATILPAEIAGIPVYDEDGLIEDLTVLGYALCAVLILILGGWAFARTKALGILAILFLLIFRELNFHTRFTTMSMTKTSFYLSADVPFVEKLAAILVGAFVIWVGLTVVLRYARPFLIGLRARQPMILAIACAMIGAVLSEVLDGLRRKLADVGLVLPESSEQVFTRFEETIELGIPLFLIIAVVMYFSSRNLEESRALGQRREGGS